MHHFEKFTIFVANVFAYYPIAYGTGFQKISSYHILVLWLKCYERSNEAGVVYLIFTF